MADVVLIYPYIGDMDVVREKPHLPLGLIQAAVLTAQEFDVRIVDLRLEPSWKDVLRRELAQGPLLAGLSVMSGRPVARAWEVSKFIRAASETPVIWGGNHPTLSPRETLSDPAVDMAVIGDGEETLLEIVQRLSQKKSLAGVPGVWFKEDGRIVENPLRGPVDLNALPQPPYHLVDVNDYIQEYRGRRMLNIETSRGCAHHCRYCYHTGRTGHHRFRALSVEKTLERIFWARDAFDVDGVYLVDDNFFLNVQRGREVVHALKRASRPLHWQIQGVDVPSMLQFTPGQLDGLEQSGLLRISVGAESGSPRVLKIVNKPHTVDMILEANRLWSRTGIIIFYSWLAGVPGETLADLRQTVRAMFRVMKDNPHARLSPIYNFLPFPGTDLWEEVTAKHGFTPPRRLQDWGDYDWSRVNVAYLDPSMKNKLNNLYFPSLCIDHKFEDYPAPWWLKRGVDLYRPLAKLRMKTLFSGIPVEKYAAALFEKLLAAAKRNALPNGGRGSLPPRRGETPWTL